MIDANCLLRLVHNDFHDATGIFALFDGLEVTNMDETFEVGEVSDNAEPVTTPTTNGTGKKVAFASTAVNGAIPTEVNGATVESASVQLPRPLVLN